MFQDVFIYCSIVRFFVFSMTSNEFLAANLELKLRKFGMTLFSILYSLWEEVLIYESSDLIGMLSLYIFGKP